MNILEDLVSPAWCADRIAELTARGFDPTGDRYPRNYRDNDRLVVDDAALAAWLFDRARSSLPAVLDIDGEHWELAGLNTRFRACRYRDGQAFCIHRDGPHVASDDVRSHLTMQIYLDADPLLAGGRTRFYAGPSGGTPTHAITPRTGTAIVFDHRAWHDGEAVTGGTKHVLRTDVMYRRTRNAARADARHVIGRHAGYAWRAIVCGDGSIASVGRDGCVRRWFADGRCASLPLGLGSITAVVEGRQGVLWCGTRAGALVRTTENRFDIIATDLGAVLALAIASPGEPGRAATRRVAESIASPGEPGRAATRRVAESIASPGEPGRAATRRVAESIDRDGVVASTARGELVACSHDGRVRWSRPVHAGWAWCVTPHPLGVASCGEDGRVAITEPTGTSSQVHAQLGVACRAIVTTPSGALVAGDTRGLLHAIALTGDVTSWAAHAGAITSLAAAADTIVSSSEDTRVIRWTHTEGELVATAPDFVTSVAIDRADIICAGYDGVVWRV